MTKHILIFQISDRRSAVTKETSFGTVWCQVTASGPTGQPIRLPDCWFRPQPG